MRRLYSIYDKVAEDYGPVYEAVNDAVAVRAYVRLMQQQGAVNMGDYDLVCVGEIDFAAPSGAPKLVYELRKIDVAAMLADRQRGGEECVI